MEFIYIVVENGEAYPAAYKTYELAAKAVDERHREEVNRQLEDSGETACDIDVPENPKGTSYLYVEKGIHILIHRLKVMGQPSA
jgi:hypothetical protein